MIFVINRACRKPMGTIIHPYIREEFIEHASISRPEFEILMNSENIKNI